MQIGHLGHERHRRAAFAVTAGLGALRDDDVGAAVDGVLCVAAGLHLADEQGAGFFDAGGERQRVAERQEDGGRVARENTVEQLRLLLQRPGDEAATHGYVAGGAELGIEPINVTIAAANQSQTAGGGHRSGEPSAGRERHRRGNDRMPDAELLCQPRVQCHVFGSRVACLRHATSHAGTQHPTLQS